MQAYKVYALEKLVLVNEKSYIVVVVKNHECKS